MGHFLIIFFPYQNYMDKEISLADNDIDRDISLAKHYIDRDISLSKNPAYGRQSISRPMRIVAPIPQ